jgi:hypothetical protein
VITVRHLVYRQERTTAFEVEERNDARFCFCGTAMKLILLRAAVIKRMGCIGALKMLAKLATPSRSYYCLVGDGRIVGDGHIARSFCRFYPVDPGSAVIGPVWTHLELRGKGLAVFGMKNAMNALIQRGCRVFYVDRSEQNLSMQHVIAKCGFGESIRVFERDDLPDWL